MFDTCLPHLKTLAKWYKAVDGKPAFTKISSTALKARADAEKLRTKICVCVLIFDEIALHLQTEIGRKKLLWVYIHGDPNGCRFTSISQGGSGLHGLKFKFYLELTYLGIFFIEGIF